MKRKANPKVIHICNSYEPTLRPKITKKIFLANAKEEMKIVVNLKDKMTKMNEH